MIKQLINGKWVIWGEKDRLKNAIINKLDQYRINKKRGVNVFACNFMLDDILEKVRKFKKRVRNGTL